MASLTATLVVGLYDTRCACGRKADSVAGCDHCGPFTRARRDSSGGSWLSSDEQSYHAICSHYGVPEDAR